MAATNRVVSRSPSQSRSYSRTHDAYDRTEQCSVGEGDWRTEVTALAGIREWAYPRDMETEQVGNPGSRRTGKRRRPLRRALLGLGCLILGILVWLISSFAVYML